MINLPEELALARLWFEMSFDTLRGDQARLDTEPGNKAIESHLSIEKTSLEFWAGQIVALEAASQKKSALPALPVAPLQV